jgi:hypothetical protein
MTTGSTARPSRGTSSLGSHTIIPCPLIALVCSNKDSYDQLETCLNEAESCRVLASRPSCYIQQLRLLFSSLHGLRMIPNLQSDSRGRAASREDSVMAIDLVALHQPREGLSFPRTWFEFCKRGTTDTLQYCTNVILHTAIFRVGRVVIR